jgi:hypothetical protein
MTDKPPPPEELLALMRRVVQLAQLLPRFKDGEDLALQFDEDPSLKADTIVVLAEINAVQKQIDMFLDPKWRKKRAERLNKGGGSATE